MLLFIDTETSGLPTSHHAPISDLANWPRIAPLAWLLSDAQGRCRQAEKAHNARDMVLDARRNAESWDRFKAGLDGTVWYLLRIHQTLRHRLPASRSTGLLGEGVKEILTSDAYQPAPCALRDCPGGVGGGLPGAPGNAPERISP